MLTRAIAGAVFVSLLVFSLLFHSYSFLGLFYFFMIVSVFEMSKMLQVKNKIIYLIATLLFLTHSNLLPVNYISYLEAGTIIACLGLFANQLFTIESNAIKELGAAFLTLLYACVPFLFMIKIPFFTGAYEGTVLLGLFILIWSNDTFAYLTGKSIGKHKLMERISPKKTIEGFVGGFIATMLIGYFLAFYFQILTSLQWLLIALIVSLFGVVGDLTASMFKRLTGTKDTGKIIPGHGGIIDRLDSIIFVAPFIYLYLKITLENVS
ncbi:phosphatidate cytidylyltransferase [Flavicella sediminum]|uniref:phosphatidate cytidylyltransferase n=1 Tax=Flavicella sediminum TaxID=2585141 RepID=UPI00140D2FF8|nr:phosphatidate cytidylyltransferase [Flavicella sediminum]